MPRPSTDHQEDAFPTFPLDGKFPRVGIYYLFPLYPLEMNDTGQLNVHENVGSWPLQPIRMAAARRTLFIRKRKLHTKRETYENESAEAKKNPWGETWSLRKADPDSITISRK